MTRIVNALEEQGLVVREKNAEDGRSIRLSATIAGKKLLLAARNQRVRSLARQIDALASAEQSILRQAVQILATVVRAI
jgi:DNA-binding MarR family transcriptional regulator